MRIFARARDVVGRPLTIIAALLLFQLLVGLTWVLIADCPLGVFDLERGDEYATALKMLLNGDGADKLIGALGQNDYFPPLYEIGLGLVMAVAGFGPASALWLNLLLLGIGCWGMYDLGRRIGGRLEGLLAASLLGMIPSLAMGLRVASKEMALALWTPAFLAWVARSDGLSRRRETLIAALLFSAGMLIKWNFLIVALPAAAAWAVFDWQRDARRSEAARIGPRLINLALGSALGLALLAPWYFGVMDWHAIRVHSTIDPTYLDSGSHWTYYLENLLTHHLLLPGALIVLAGGVASLCRRRLELLPAVVWIVVGYLVLSALPHKESRYILPLLPALALVVAHGACAMPWRPLRWLLAGLLIIGGGWQVLQLSFVRPMLVTESAGLVPVADLSCLGTAKRAADWIESSVPLGQRGALVVMHPLSRDDVFLGQHALSYWLRRGVEQRDWVLAPWDSNRYPDLVCGIGEIELLLVPLHLRGLQQWERESLARDLRIAFPDFTAIDESDPALIKIIEQQFRPLARLEVPCGVDQDERRAGFVLYGRSSPPSSSPEGCP
ncbi:MAG: glycosyltransferase family 39 protein [Candidatus Alcyoniella australis]|nr:glycosyltransferase family 39 protein [Candidatus Alcyoniella australis]